MMFSLFLACVDAKPDSGQTEPVDTDVTGTPTGDTGTPTDDSRTTPTDTGDSGPPTGPDTVDDDGDGQSEAQGDCDDADPTVASWNPEECDGLDQNCDGRVDEGCGTTPCWSYEEYNWFIEDGEVTHAERGLVWRNLDFEILCEAMTPLAPTTSIPGGCPDCTWTFGGDAGALTWSGDHCASLAFMMNVDWISEYNESTYDPEWMGYVGDGVRYWDGGSFPLYQLIYTYRSSHNDWVPWHANVPELSQYYVRVYDDRVMSSIPIYEYTYW